MTEQREWPNVCANTRDNAAEIVKGTIESLGKIIKNEVNDEEAIEALVAKVILDQVIVLRCLEKLGANTNPIIELDNRILQHRTNISFAPARP